MSSLRARCFPVWQRQMTSRAWTFKKAAGILLTVFGVLFLIGCMIFTLSYLREKSEAENAAGNAGENTRNQEEGVEDPFAEITAGMSSTTGEIVETEERISIRYSVDGNDYYALLPRIVRIYRVGDPVEVFYDPEDPARNAVPEHFTNLADSMYDANIRITGTVGKLFGIVGAVMLAAGILLLYKAHPGDAA